MDILIRNGTPWRITLKVIYSTERTLAAGKSGSCWKLLKLQLNCQMRTILRLGAKHPLIKEDFFLMRDAWRKAWSVDAIASKISILVNSSYTDR